MKIDHIHFFVDDAPDQRDWFVRCLGWEFVEHITLQDRIVEVLRYRGTPFVLSSPRSPDSPVAAYLRTYAPGVVDIAIEVDDLSAFLHRPGVSPRIIVPPQQPGISHHPLPHHPLSPHPLTDSLITQQGGAIAPSHWARIAGWGRLYHTIIERHSSSSSSSAIASAPVAHNRQGSPQARQQGIDHIVLNVPKGDLQGAVSFYQEVFALQSQQRFKIQTAYSGLNSQVLFDPRNQLYFNINEPTSDNSQIQTFIESNRGAGIQHIALHSDPIVPTVTELRRQGAPLLSVPKTYYQHLWQRWQTRCPAPISPHEWQQIVNQCILLDWQPERPEAMLLQIFSQPIFENNHFFLEFIERRHAVKGFGEGNFLALYQAIEAEMMRSPLSQGAAT